MATFESLRTKVDKMKINPGNLADKLDDILDRARINADNTCYLEKASKDWNYIAVATISDILSTRNIDKDVIKWFLENGVEF